MFLLLEVNQYVSLTPSCSCLPGSVFANPATGCRKVGTAVSPSPRKSHSAAGSLSDLAGLCIPAAPRLVLVVGYSTASSMRGPVYPDAARESYSVRIPQGNQQITIAVVVNPRQRINRQPGSNDHVNVELQRQRQIYNGFCSQTMTLMVVVWPALVNTAVTPNWRGHRYLDHP